MPKHSISVAMCVKDEAESLAASIQSILPAVDEVVIGVDDSCTDATPEIAHQLGTPGKVFDFTWRDDFSAARNEVLKRCDGDLIFILDGHEIVPHDDHPINSIMARMRGVDLEEESILTPLSMLENVREHGIPDPFEVVCIILAMNTDRFGIPQLFFLQPRLFWNHRGIHYESAVHNHLAGYERNNALGDPQGILIHNMPPKREEKRKKQRKSMNITGLKEKAKEDPQNARPLFYIANSYADMGKPGQAITWYKKYLKLSTFPEERYQALQQLAVLTYRHAKKPAEARQYALEAASLQWNRREPYIVMAETAAEADNHEEALHYFKLAEKIPAPGSVMFMQGPAYSFLPPVQKTICYEKLGNQHKALEACQEALSWRPGDQAILAKMQQLKTALGTRRTTPDRNLLMVDRLGSFSKDLGKALSQDFTVAVKEKCDPRWQAWADLAFFEWCDENIVEASQDPWDCPVVCRLHSYEAFGNVPAQVNWNNVDALIFVAEHIKQLFLSKWPKVAEQTQLHVIPNGITQDGLTFKERDHGKRIGYLGYLNHKKGVTYLVEAMKSFPDYEFHVAGQFQDPHLAYYFQAATQDLNNFWWHGWVAPEQKDEWLEGVDYLLSPSIVESFGYSIAEAMLKGIKPLVHERPGAIWADTWRTVPDLAPLLEGAYDSAAYRDHILDNFHLDKQVALTRQLLFSLFAK